MLNVLKTVPAVCFAVLLSGQMAGAADYLKLPKFGPVPQPRPIQMVEAKASAETGLVTVARCSGECIAYRVAENQMR